MDCHPSLPVEEISEIYHSPFLELVLRASNVHKKHHRLGEVQVCTLLSVKTGGCSEDCAYCSQSIRYTTGVKVHKLLDVELVVSRARDAKEGGATRFCMGAAWREVRSNRDFEKILEMVSRVSLLGLEVCCTLGMLSGEQARRLKQAGLYAYNHNLDSGPEFYKKVITTRSYGERLETLKNVRDAGVSVCCGGIIGMGETVEDRIELLHVLHSLPEPPESIPINALVPVPGTPMENQPPVPFDQMTRMIATTRILMPESMVRLSAGRLEMTMEAQALCFLAGANSIFSGEKLLTTPNPRFSQDRRMFQTLDIRPRESYLEKRVGVGS